MDVEIHIWRLQETFKTILVHNYHKMLHLKFVPKVLKCQMHTDGYKLEINPWSVLAANVFQTFTTVLCSDAIPTCGKQVCLCVNGCLSEKMMISHRNACL